MKVVVLGGLPLNGERSGYLNHIDKLTQAISAMDNIEMHVITLGKKNGDFKKNNVNVHVVSDSCLYVPFLFPITIWSMISKLISIRPDVVHGGGVLPYTTVAALVRNKYPSLLSMFSISAKDIAFDRRNILKILGKFLFVIPNERYVISKTRHIIVQSKFTEGLVKKWTNSNIYIVPEGIESQRIQQVGSHEPSIDKCDIFIAVSLRWWKGLDVLIKSIPTVLEQVPDLKVYIAGSGPQENELKELVDQLHLNKYIKFLGFIYNEEIINNYYRNSKIVVAPSRWDVEPFAPLDAAVFGRPSIVSEMCNSSLVEDGRTGFVIRSEDIEDLASKITVLLCDDRLRATMGEAARDKVKEYDWKNIASRTVEIYKKVIEESRARV